MANWCLIKAQPGCSLKMMIKSCFLWSWDIQQAKCHHGWLLVKDNLTKMVPPDANEWREPPEVAVVLWWLTISGSGSWHQGVSPVTMTTSLTMGAQEGGMTHDTGTLCLLNYVGVDDTEYVEIYFHSHLLKHLENISGGQSIINWSSATSSFIFGVTSQ